MREISSDILLNMQTATGLQPDETFRENFYFTRELPDNLQFLDALSQNFYWSWKPEGARLFRELDSQLWEQCEQNPRLLLKKISGLRLWQKAGDEKYVSELQSFAEQFNNYVAAEPDVFGQITERNPVAYFCAEYGVHNSLPIYSGGLGILAGDHLKSASDMKVPLVAVGLLYRYGYFRQKIAHNGWQTENYLIRSPVNWRSLRFWMKPANEFW
jgi:starch phosphorylase